MTKYYDQIGFVDTVETVPGVFEEDVVLRHYSGDVEHNIHRYRGAEVIHDDVVIGNRVSIIADDYAMNNFFKIKFLCWRGAQWKVQSIEVVPPRILLRMGGLHNA